MEQETSRQTKQHDKKNKGPVNYWKWAFLGLFAILLGFSLFIGSRIFVPSKEVTNHVEVLETASFDVNLDKKRANQIIAHYLKNYLSNKSISYEFNLDKEAVLVGNFELLGHKVQFFLYFEPMVLENGNVRLEAKNISIGDLNLPITYLMSYIAKAYPLPEWVSVEASKKSILLNLSKINLPDDIQIRAKKIDLDADEIKLEVGIPLEEKTVKK